jgi:hypothetical protein
MVPAKPWVFAGACVALLAASLGGCAADGPAFPEPATPPRLENHAVIAGSFEQYPFYTAYAYFSTVDGQPAYAYACDPKLTPALDTQWRCAEPGLGQDQAWTWAPWMQSGQVYQPPPAGERMVVNVTPGTHSLGIVRDVADRTSCWIGSAPLEGTCESNRPGYVYHVQVTFSALAGHKYTAFTDEADGRYWSWVIDEGSGEIAAGQAPPTGRQ